MPMPHIEDTGDVLERLVRENGPMDLDWLAARARKELHDMRVDADVIAAVVDMSALLVLRPDGSVSHLMNVLDGMILTQRARAPLAGRTDLWCTVALQPLLNLATFTPIPLADGSGDITPGPSGHDVLMGPPGWLPDIPRYGVVGLRLENGALSAVPVDEADLPDLEAQESTRQLIARHYRVERWYSGEDDLETRPAEMVRALMYARLEDPDLFSTPQLPLDELLYLSLEGDNDLHYWRDRAATVGGTVSFSVTGMPEALCHELSNRARRYGMSLDQYVVAVLGHLAWRTPFAEDMHPWDDWDPDRRKARLRLLPASPEPHESG